MCKVRIKSSGLYSQFGDNITDIKKTKNITNRFFLGAMAERTSLKAYILFSFLNFTSYVFPAHWMWHKTGFLYKLHVVDIAGCGPVHLVGGISAIVATLMLKPR